MMVRRRFLPGATLVLAGGTAAAAALLAAGCGSGTGPSSFGWNLTSMVASDSKAAPNVRVGDPVSIAATYYAEVRGVNAGYYTGVPPAIGEFNAEWSEVPVSPGAAPRAVFASTVGTTTTSYASGTAPNVRVFGDSSNTVQFSQAGTVTLRLHVNFQASDGSRHSKDFDVTLNVLPPSGA